MQTHSRKIYSTQLHNYMYMGKVVLTVHVYFRCFFTTYCYCVPVGVADVNALFTKLDVPQTIKDKYINLLEKFEVALTIKGQRIIIPSLLPDSTCFPKTDDNLSDVKMFQGIDDCYQPPLRRLWLSGYIPKGFWPRLICRVVNDQQIGKVRHLTLLHLHVHYDTCIVYMYVLDFNVSND